ncbi:MAG: hypothetical protein J0L62_13605 [Bacteroidetes bacterium]|nr:hypothetical protein [Bacteroidota bacterium]
MRILYFLMVVLLSGCSDKKEYSSQKDLPGEWKAFRAEVTSVSANETLSFSMDQFGKGSLVLGADSSCVFSMSLSRDLIIEKDVLGNSYRKTILHSGFSTYQRGYYSATDSILLVLDYNKKNTQFLKYGFQEQTLLTHHADKKNLQWKIFWEK